MSITTEGNILTDNKTITGTAVLRPGFSMTIQRFIVGFGVVTVTITTDTATASKDFILLLIFFKEV